MTVTSGKCRAMSASCRALLLPVGHIENAAAHMRLQTRRCGRRARCACRRSCFELRDGHAELGVRAGGANVMMMAAARAGIDAHEDLACPGTTPARRVSAYRLSTVTRTPRSRAQAYSSRGAKLGVKRMRAGSRSGNSCSARSTSPRDTHSKLDAFGVHRLQQPAGASWPSSSSARGQRLHRRASARAALTLSRS